MKILIAYYSFEGNCRGIAKALSEETGGELLEIRPTLEKVTHGRFLKYLQGGKASLFKDAPEIEPWKNRLEEYDLIFVGGPVWAFRMAPAVRSFLQKVVWSGRRAALFVMHRGTPGSALNGMSELVRERGGTVVGTAGFFDLRWRKGAESKEKAVAWARSLLAKS